MHEMSQAGDYSIFATGRVKWWNTGHLTTKPSVALSSEDFFMISKRQMVKKL